MLRFIVKVKSANTDSGNKSAYFFFHSASETIYKSEQIAFRSSLKFKIHNPINIS